MTITAVVPIRKGSQRVENKNFRPFAHSNLLEIKLEALKSIKQIDQIIVNTNSERAIQIAKKHKVDFYRREEYYASSECTNTEHWYNLAETTETDYFMHTPCTAPLIKKTTYSQIIDKFKSNLNLGFDSINTAALVKDYLYLNNKTLNFDPKKVPNSQNLPDVYKPTFGVSIISREKMMLRKNLVGDKPHFYVLDEIESVDIDYPIDFKFAEFLYKKML